MLSPLVEFGTPMSPVILGWLVSLSQASPVPKKPRRPAPMKKSVSSPYLTAEEAVEYLRLPSLPALYALVQRGRIHPLPGHRRFRFTVKDLDRYLNGGR